jgi:hypothetical protein
LASLFGAAFLFQRKAFFPGDAETGKRQAEERFFYGSEVWIFLKKNAKPSLFLWLSLFFALGF